MTQTPAGWYPDGHGSTRYWNGTQWTDQVQAAAAAQPPLTPQPQQAPHAPQEYQLHRPHQAAGSQGAGAQASSSAATGQPRGTLMTNRSLLKYILLGIITLGIYSIWVVARSGSDLNTIASRYDNRRTMNFWLVALLLGWLTFGIVTIIWWHTTSNRIGDELERRGKPRQVSASTFWLWYVVGSLIVIGPFVFMYKWLHSMNDISADYNVRG